MSWLDALFGRARVPKSRLEQLFALTTAQVTLETSFGLRPSGRAGLVFRAVESSFFETAEQELAELLQLARQETGTTVSRQRDRYGYEWLVLEDEQLEDLVATAHQVGQTLQDHGFGDRLLAAVFGFKDADGLPAYWIYNYKRASFYPFAPLAGEQRRNNPLELRLAAVMRRELPLEPDQARWYPLWGAPVE
ncbi:MAG: hypothetical protein HY690_12075 [Chloroflexi bacterium]|nr:hypothetical protein [Chloroflexota bacterium]